MHKHYSLPLPIQILNICRTFLYFPVESFGYYEYSTIWSSPAVFFIVADEHSHFV